MVSLLTTSMTPLEWAAIAALLLSACGVMAWIWRSGRTERDDEDDE